MLLGRFTSSIGAVGVEYGQSAVRLLQVREQNESLHVVGAGAFDLSSDAKGQVSPALLTERLRSAFTSGRFTGRRCVVSLPRSAVQVQAVRLPRMPDAELRQAVTWEAAQRLGVERSELQVDFLRTSAPVRAGDQREEVLMIAAPTKVLHFWLEPLLAAGMRPMAVDTDFGAVGRLFSRRYRREADRDAIRALLDVGSTTSMLQILRGDRVAFCKSITIGQDQFDQAVADHLQMDMSSARELRASRTGVDGRRDDADGAFDPATDRAVFEAVRPLLGDLVKEVTLCLRYYGVTFRGAPPDRLILCGEGIEPKLDEMLAAACKMPVALDDPPDSLAVIRAEIRQLLNREPGPMSSWAIAAGLSLRGLLKFRQSRRRDDPAVEPAEPVRSAA